ncbi:MAG TPA: peptidoglycan DD-metalloendopeptidase family protein [Burkholderiales bacterium]|nr:peptidoglycan DD-metalloendopeptidase family protein [Burkholderiales bacterium]
MRAILAVLAVALAAGCGPTRWQAPIEDRRPAARAPAKAPTPVSTAGTAAAPEGFYTVQKGDTLYSIALEHGHDYREVAQWNSLDDPGKIRVGQVLRVKAPAEPAVVVGAGRQGNRIESRPLGSPEQKPVAVAKEEPKLEAGPLTFAWPVKGKVLAGFAEPRQKGIDIEGRAGDAVTAAAAGRVTYVGSGIPGLGKLVVIKHDQGYITVYAHNKDILVKEQQAVTRGQKIAELGEKLHFQIRKGAAAVDPLRYLPKS